MPSNCSNPDLASKNDGPIGKTRFRISGLRRSDPGRLFCSWWGLSELANQIDVHEGRWAAIHNLIEQAKRIAVDMAEIRMLPRSIEGRLAGILQTGFGTPAPSIVRRDVDENGLKFGTTLAVHHERRFEYSIGLRRELFGETN